MTHGSALIARCFTIWLVTCALVATLLLPSTPDPIFREIAVETGLNFQHFTGATGEYFMPEIMGAGTALMDYDNDGDLDAYLIQGTAFEGSKKFLFPPR